MINPQSGENSIHKSMLIRVYDNNGLNYGFAILISSAFNRIEIK